MHCLPGLFRGAKHGAMKAFLTALIIGLSTPTIVLAKSPLTPAEQRVCRSLNHCLKIIDAHPHDSFDYAVLAEEFRRFEPKGRDALLRKIKKGGQSAGHAADLLALTRDASALPRLSDMAARSDEPSHGLAARTEHALTARLGLVEKPMESPESFHGLYTEASCLREFPDNFDARKNEMPFFEADIATPDQHGAFRPSATFRFEPSHASFPEPYMSRGWLRAAVPVPGGWFAAYPNGLVYYDNKTGAPDIRDRSCIVSLQSRDATSLSSHIWAFSERSGLGTSVLDIGPNSRRIAAHLPGRLSHILRLPDGNLCVMSDDSAALTLRTDGTTAPDCLKDQNP